MQFGEKSRAYRISPSGEAKSEFYTVIEQSDLCITLPISTYIRQTKEVAYL